VGFESGGWFALLLGFQTFAGVSVRCIFGWDNDDADKNEWEYKKGVSK
jgi:hypothetical protein